MSIITTYRIRQRFQLSSNPFDLQFFLLLLPIIFLFLILSFFFAFNICPVFCFSVVFLVIQLSTTVLEDSISKVIVVSCMCKSLWFSLLNGDENWFIMLCILMDLRRDVIIRFVIPLMNSEEIFRAFILYPLYCS